MYCVTAVPILGRSGAAPAQGPTTNSEDLPESRHNPWSNGSLPALPFTYNFNARGIRINWSKSCYLPVWHFHTQQQWCNLINLVGLCRDLVYSDCLANFPMFTAIQHGFGLPLFGETWLYILGGYNWWKPVWLLYILFKSLLLSASFTWHPKNSFEKLKFRPTKVSSLLGTESSATLMLSYINVSSPIRMCTLGQHKKLH